MLDTFCWLGQNSGARQIVAEQSRELHHKYNANGRLFNGVIRGCWFEGPLRATDVAQQIFVIDRGAGGFCGGVLLHWSFLNAQPLST